VLELFIIFVLIILIIIQVVKRKNNQKQKTVPKKGKKDKLEDKVVKQEVDKTKVISKEEIEKINNSNKE